MNTRLYEVPPISGNTKQRTEQFSLFIYKHGNKLLLYLLLTALSIPFIFPFWWMFTSAFKPPNDIFAYPVTREQYNVPAPAECLDDANGSDHCSQFLAHADAPADRHAHTAHHPAN